MKLLSTLGRSGFTLVETLIVIAIILILCGILLPALAKAREQGLKLSDLSAMKQVAIAGCLYNDNYGQFPLLTTELVDAKLLPPEICKLRLDPYQQGLSNHFVRNISGLGYLLAGLPAYPQSFITFGNLGNPRSRLDGYLAKPSAGWAYTGIDLRPELTGIEIWGSHFYRIQVDGSVPRYPVPIRSGVAIEFDDFFFDSA
ncbi:MAG TPA: prepilin-type N-terminal cleavage/methylation domain-containing protein [Fimbriimonas sp.]|nr:prepilin-type N-terminal cleavage/methylation domain-containing protein [Fimbriimonas sp.]